MIGGNPDSAVFFEQVPKQIGPLQINQTVLVLASLEPWVWEKDENLL